MGPLGRYGPPHQPGRRIQAGWPRGRWRGAHPLPYGRCRPHRAWRGACRPLLQVQHARQAVGRVRPLGFEVPDVEFEEGENRFEIGFRLPDVRVWSTWDRGEQPLYELVLSCERAEMRRCFGARTVELRDWKVYLNGERIFLRGINYLPSDAYP